jgi:N-acetyltransferase
MRWLLLVCVRAIIACEMTASPSPNSQRSSPSSSQPGSAPGLPAATAAFEPLTLEGRVVRLEPLTLAHVDGLSAVGLDPELWAWTSVAMRTREEMQTYVEEAIAEQAAGMSLPFATVERATGTIVGTTRFANISRANRRAEIGWTFVAKPWQRTPVNTEAKLLMLRYAFEACGCLRVELKTDRLNEKSRAAIARLGALEEGIFRQHMITATGRRRDTVYFSIIDAEWPAVRDRLEARLASG